ncbi:MAG: ATP-binding protein [Candidatus Woesearchaeota archaeon]
MKQKSTSELKEGIISIVSILNKHQKGELYFGVKNNGEIVGQTVTEKTIRDISKSISDNIEPKIFPKIKEVVLEGKKCVHIEFLGENVPYYAFINTPCPLTSLSFIEVVLTPQLGER